MKLKIYMRGLGIGILVTALIMGIATKDGRPMTDAEIKAAAAKLGMVESDALKLSDLPRDEGETKELQNDELGDSEPAESLVPASEMPTPEGTEGTEEPESSSGPATSGLEPETDPVSNTDSTASPAPSPSQAPAPSPAPSPSPEPVQEPESAGDTEIVGDTETVKFTIKSGTGSRAVCNQLAEAGLIQDAAAFDQYLCDNSYARRVCAGTFEIPRGASEEQIAKIITKSR